MKPTYYAITTTNPQTGWWILGTAPSREEATALQPSPVGDIYNQTKHVNFRVLSKTQMIARFGRAGLAGMIENWAFDARA